MKFIKYFFLMAGVAVLSTACSKDDDTEELSGDPNKVVDPDHEVLKNDYFTVTVPKDAFTAFNAQEIRPPMDQDWPYHYSCTVMRLKSDTTCQMILCRTLEEVDASKYDYYLNEEKLAYDYSYFTKFGEKEEGARNDSVAVGKETGTLLAYIYSGANMFGGSETRRWIDSYYTMYRPSDKHMYQVVLRTPLRAEPEKAMLEQVLSTYRFK